MLTGTNHEHFAYNIWKGRTTIGNGVIVGWDLKGLFLLSKDDIDRIGKFENVFMEPLFISLDRKSDFPILEEGELPY
jgi:hypothetical protein